MKQLHSHRVRPLTTVVTLTGPGTVRCGLCSRTLRTAYKSGYPAPCGCNWLWYDGRLAAYPNRAVQRQRELAPNRRA